MFVMRVILILLAVLLLRRALGWVIDKWARVTSSSAGHGSPRRTPRHESERMESLSDQRIDEAEYEELG